ncbi:hypothetical protein TNCV_2425191 [Trichonephila clavipes]|nr:hypothetical protein TNCV_2425191 [Trichonephila clavipes]
MRAPPRRVVTPLKGGAPHSLRNAGPDHNLPDFFLFPRHTLASKGKRFGTIPDIQRNMTRLLNSISKEDFLKSFPDMYSRSQLWVVMGGDYFERHTMYIETFVIPLDKLQKALQEKLRVLRTEEEFNRCERMTTQQVNTHGTDTSFVSTLGTCYAVLRHSVEIERRDSKKNSRASQIWHSVLG